MNNCNISIRIIVYFQLNLLGGEKNLKDYTSTGIMKCLSLFLILNFSRKILLTLEKIFYVETIYMLKKCYLSLLIYERIEYL